MALFKRNITQLYDLTKYNCTHVRDASRRQPALVLGSSGLGDLRGRFINSWGTLSPCSRSVGSAPGRHRPGVERITLFRVMTPRIIIRAGYGTTVGVCGFPPSRNMLGSARLTGGSGLCRHSHVGWSALPANCGAVAGPSARDHSTPERQTCGHRLGIIGAALSRRHQRTRACRIRQRDPVRSPTRRNGSGVSPRCVHGPTPPNVAEQFDHSSGIRRDRHT